MGSYVFYEDLVRHAQEDKENLGVVTVNLLARAVYEFFGVSVTKARKRPNKKCSSLKLFFRNLPKKSHEKRVDGNVELQRDWNELQANMDEIVNGLDGDWQSMSSEDSISFITIDKLLRCDGKRIVYEVIFLKKGAEGKIETEMLCYQRRVMEEVMRKVEVFCCDMNIIEKAKQYLIIFEKSTLCGGFPIDVEMNDIEPVYNVGVKKHHLTQNQSGVSEERVFSLGCEVVTENSNSEICARCARVKRSMKQRGKRKEKIEEPSVKWNHRYMSGDQLVEKIAVERKRAYEEKRKLERLEEELLEIEENDHKDLLQMMSQVEKKGILEDMQVLWEQQEKIAKTESKKGYRWHPR